MDISPRIKFFTVLDGCHGYWQVPRSKDSKSYTCFITRWGLYRFKRNVMGLISAGDEHNLREDKTLSRMENVKIMENIVIPQGSRGSPGAGERGPGEVQSSKDHAAQKEGKV